MSTCRARQILDGQLEGPPVLSSPLVNSTVYQMEQTESYYPFAHRVPEKMAQLAESIHTLFGFEGVRVPFDLCVEAEALGCEINMKGQPAFPYITKSLQVQLQPFDITANIFEHGRIPVVMQALNYLKEKYENHLPLYAGCTAPFTLGGYLWEAEEYFTLPIEDPDRLSAILDWLVNLVGDYANQLLEAGANAIVLIDPSASFNMISPRVFERFLLPVYDRLKNIIQGRIILHICGDTNGLLNLIQQTGFAGFSFEGPSVTVRNARSVLGNRMALIGNIPTSDSLLFGNPSQVKQDARRALAEGIHMLAPACSIPPETPPENLFALRQVCEEYADQVTLN